MLTDTEQKVWRQRISAGLPADVDAWTHFLKQRIQLRGGHAICGHLCEEAGLSALARREYQLAIRDNPTDQTASIRLASLLCDDGDTVRALGLYEAVVDRDPACSEALIPMLAILRDEEAMPRMHAVMARAVAAGFPEDQARRLMGPMAPASAASNPPIASDPNQLTFTDPDCARFHAIFAGREDTYARQWSEQGGTGYTPVNEPFTPAVARQHFLGTCTVGIYPIRLDGTCTYCAIDLDITKVALEKATRRQSLAQELRANLRATASLVLDRLRSLGLSPLFEHSGYKGRHYWIMLDQPEPAEILHQFGRLLLPWLAPVLGPDFHLEFFPKQGTLKGKGLGNLIKVPLGIHRRTGHRAHLLDDAGNPLSDPFAALRNITRHPRSTIIRIMDLLKGAPVNSRPIQPNETAATGLDESTQAITTPRPPRCDIGWTEADFDLDPHVSHLLNRCPVMRALKFRADQQRTLSHDEQLTLVHTMGHLPTGPLAVNHLLAKCLDVGSDKYLKDNLKGSPTSCPTIRRRIPLITRSVNCHCDFSFAPDRYPTPVLHLLTMPAQSPSTPPRLPGKSPAELAAALLISSIKLNEIQGEEKALRLALIAALRAHPERAVSFASGTYSLVENDGVEELIFTAAHEPPAGTTAP